MVRTRGFHAPQGERIPAFLPTHRKLKPFLLRKINSFFFSLQVEDKLATMRIVPWLSSFQLCYGLLEIQFHNVDSSHTIFISYHTWQIRILINR